MAEYDFKNVANRLAWPAMLVLAVVTGIYLTSILLVRDPGLNPHPVAEPPIAISSHSLDFGSVPLHGSVARQLVLRNDSDAPVVALLAFGEPGAFSISAEQLTLDPGVSSLVSVTMDAAEPGLLRDELEIFLGGHAAPIVVELNGRVATDVAGLSESGVDHRSLVSGNPSYASDVAQTRQGSPGVPSSSDAKRRAQVHGASVTGSSGSVTRVPTTLVVSGSTSAGSPSGPAGAGSETAATPEANARRRRPKGGGRANDASRTQVRSETAPQVVPAGAAAMVIPYDPTRSAPVGDLTEPAQPVPTEITPEEKAAARPLSDPVPDAGSEHDTNDGENLFDDEPFKDPAEPDEEVNPEEPEPPDPFEQPRLIISASSTVSLLGSSTTFYPQEIGVLGTEGGPFQLVQPIQFPIVPLAFGESVAIAQSGASAGVFDAYTGQVTLQMPLSAIDSDGDAAPLIVELTTGTAFGRNEAGQVVALSGSPRMPGSQTLRLVGLQTIPINYNNGAEGHLVIFDVMAYLSFGSSATAGF